MNDLRIALIGSHGTGKTSIVNELFRITKIPVIEELARGYNLNTSDMYEYEEFQHILLLEQIKSETLRILLEGSFISDRSSIDSVAYYFLKCKEISSIEDRRRYVEVAVHNSLHYTHLFYVPIEIPLKPDGFRFESKRFQRDIDDMIKQLIQDYDMNIITLTGSLDERIKKTLEEINWK